jgi:phosphonopyruvate decarboxylase
MIAVEDIFNCLKENNIKFFTGVPDSLLSSFCAYIEDHCRDQNSFLTHVSSTNEGNAIALGIGHNLATGEIPCVYMQNSGLGNCVNPITSLAHPQIYKVPMLLVIGWRGMPLLVDEPQHIKQGQITPDLLALLDIPFEFINSETQIDKVIRNASSAISETGGPFALLVEPDSLGPWRTTQQQVNPDKSLPSREEAIKCLISRADPADIIVATTGKASRELYEARISAAQESTDFLTVGGMGHASSIALGMALAKPDRRVICFDGDGACLMHLGAMRMIAAQGPSNFIHVVLNNEAHDSVGGQPTLANGLMFSDLSHAVGYNYSAKASSLGEIEDIWEALNQGGIDGPALLEIRIRKGARKNLGRPKDSPLKNKQTVIKHIQSF